MEKEVRKEIIPPTPTKHENIIGTLRGLLKQIDKLGKEATDKDLEAKSIVIDVLYDCYGYDVNEEIKKK